VFWKSIWILWYIHSMAIYSLSNPIKNYEWGSTSLIPDFMGFANPETKPVAEVWMGTHPGGPSRVETQSGEKDLREVHSAGVPYLMKLLAARQALSIQSHPNLEQAKDGFARENEQGVALTDGKRNYKDPNHKPEVIVALEGPFCGMAGFRQIAAIRADFAALKALASGPLPVLDELDAALEKGGLKALTRAVLSLDREAWKIQEPVLAGAFAQWSSPLAPWFPKLQKTYAGDPSMLFCIILNLFVLQPGEAIFTPAGCLHAYLEGFGLELMAASDNVLRGGLTPKAIDKDELERVVIFEAGDPDFMKPVLASSGEEVFTPSVPDFRLGCLKGQDKIFHLGSVTSPWILVVAEGSACLQQGAESLSLKKGESAVVLPGADVTVTVQGLVYRAWSGL